MQMQTQGQGMIHTNTGAGRKQLDNVRTHVCVVEADHMIQQLFRVQSMDYSRENITAAIPSTHKHKFYWNVVLEKNDKNTVQMIQY